MAATGTVPDSLSFRAGRPDRLTTWLALCGVIGPVLYVMVIMIAGLLRTSYSPIHQAVSDLGVGSNAWLLNGAGIANWLLLTALVVAFLRRTGTVLPAGWRWVCAVVLALPPLGYGVASIFTEAPATLMVHWLVGANLGLLVPIPAFAVTGIALRRHNAWRSWSNYSLASSLATLLIVASTFWVFEPSTPIASARLGGLMERIAIIEILAWYVVAGWRLARNTET